MGAQVPLLALHTAPWNWPQPERFWPERWTTPELRGGPKAASEGLASAFLPCGASCISSHVAEAQVSQPVLVSNSLGQPTPILFISCLRAVPVKNAMQFTTCNAIQQRSVLRTAFSLNIC